MNEAESCAELRALYPLPVIVRFIEEAIITLKAGSNLGCAFLLCGASEKTIYLLIDAYKKAIKNETLQTAILWVINKKVRTKLERNDSSEEIFNLIGRTGIDLAGE